MRSKFAPPFNEAIHEPGVRAYGFYKHLVGNRFVTNDLLMMEAEAVRECIWAYSSWDLACMNSATVTYKQANVQQDEHKCIQRPSKITRDL
jgi:hypothetical protein